jgi:two-component system NtrC family sensor kinase
LVESAIEFMQYQFRTSNIQVVTQLASNLPESMLDGHQMQQVFMNILNNARQAIDARSGPGHVQVTTENVEPRMRITFEDDGAGIPEENISKLFIPFFTTKEIGQGTGLGLSFCYGVVSEHGGTIQVESKIGRGSKFVIDLPLIPGVAETPPKSIATRLLTSGSPVNLNGHGKRVLVIDDEEGILEMVRGELTQHGYQVDVAQDGEEALRRLSESRYDLALCDWKMPGLTGGEVYDRLLNSNPELCQRFVFITGDVISERVQQFLKERQKKCLLKPFSLAEFRGAVEEALNEK